MADVTKSDDAGICKEILGITRVVYRPISLDELRVLLPALKDFDAGEVEELIGFCGSILSFRENFIYFLHQSAKDFLLIDAYCVIFPSGSDQRHDTIFSRSMRALMDTLRRDHYSLQHPGVLVDEINIPQPDPLAPIRYSSVHWADHLEVTRSTSARLNRNDFLYEGTIDRFMSTKYLYWLECLSLVNGMPEGVRAISKLRAIVVSYGTISYNSKSFIYTKQMQTLRV